jgi:DNA-binding ferritin-like protein
MAIEFKKTNNPTMELTKISDCVSELMNAATSFHKLHLKITGPGSLAIHLALNEIYDSLPDHSDTIAEESQGAFEKLLTYKDSTPRVLNTKEEAIQYAKELKTMITDLQKIIPFSEIVNVLDNTKSDLNKLIYKLTFLS